MKMVSDFRRRNKRSSSAAPTYTIELLADDQDLEITVDHSDILYGVSITLID